MNTVDPRTPDRSTAPRERRQRPPAQRRSGRLPGIDPARCTGCGRCVAACDLHLLSLEVQRWEKFAVLHEPERCTGCNACAQRCPFDAITLRKPAQAGPGTSADPTRAPGDPGHLCVTP